MTLRPQNIQLPVGNKPGWELDEDDSLSGERQGLKSIADRYVQEMLHATLFSNILQFRDLTIIETV
jgi:hypothetical protein